MKQSTSIFLTEKANVIHELFSCGELLPNIFIGMCIWIDGRMYRVKDIITIECGGRISQHIEVDR